jgi:D-arabinose 1-dehydrogenase-like Zn-dependent alcohol dehydrogenase
MYNTKAYSATSATSPLAGTRIARRDATEHDVQIEILFCGICHSDLHSVRNEWSEFMPTVYPIVPGHEIVGRVTKVGSSVTRYKPGDLAAVGCLVDSDRTCPRCKAGLENFCPNLTLTFNSPDKHLGGVTYGGYSDSIVVDERFVLRVPSNLELAGAAPLLFILDAVSAGHDINAYLNLLGLGGNLTLVGAPAKPLGVSAFGLIMGRRNLSGSNIGGIPETQEMLDFCGAITSPPMSK